jgi:hypothetical protein
MGFIKKDRDNTIRTKEVVKSSGEKMKFERVIGKLVREI